MRFSFLLLLTLTFNPPKKQMKMGIRTNGVSRLPDHISFTSAALLEPLSVAIHALNRAAPTPGSTALVIGAGTVGLLVAAMARQSGCTFVTIIDVDEGRVNYALEKGFATHGYVVPKPLNSSPSSSSVSTSTSASGASTPSLDAGSVERSGGGLEVAEALAADVLAVACPYLSPSSSSSSDEEDIGVDLTFECTGLQSCMQTSLYATRPGGKVIMVGMGTPIQTLPLSVAHLREIDILGVFRYANTYATGIRLLAAQGMAKGGIGGGMALPSLDEMVTHRFKGLESAGEAFELAGRKKDAEGRLVVKVVIEC